MKAKVYTQAGVHTGDMDLPGEVFGAEINAPLLHFVVEGYRANQRQGTSKTKGRSEVSGGGRKPFRQKGTGSARAGSNTSPIWKRGGKAFGPKPHKYTNPIPKKMKKLALRSALSSRAQEEKIFVIEKIEIEKPKTKLIAVLLKALSANEARNLLVVGSDAHAVYMSGRNIKNLNIKPIAEIHAYDVLQSDNIIFADKGLVEKTKEVVSL